MALREKISILVVHDTTKESFQLRIPLFLFRFLVGAFVVLVILSGVAVTWLGAISLKLQTVDVVAQENKRLKRELELVNRLREELEIVEERERRIMSITQAFLDDTVSTEATPLSGSSSSNDVYGDLERERVLADLEEHDRMDRQHRRTKPGSLKVQSLYLPVPPWRMTILPGPLQEAARAGGGLLLTVPSGEACRAPGDGVVTYVGWDPQWGQILRLDLGSGYEATIAQLTEIDVLPGDFLVKGQRLGRSGGSVGEGNGTLMLALRIDGLPVNPMISMMR